METTDGMKKKWRKKGNFELREGEKMGREEREREGRALITLYAGCSQMREKSVGRNSLGEGRLSIG
jgi:hypothetical protein